VNALKSDYFESLTSFHKPIWIMKHEIDSQLHVDENEQILTDMPWNLGDLSIDDHSDVMEISKEFSFEDYEMLDKNEQFHSDMSFDSKNLEVHDQYEIMEVEENASLENDQMIDFNSRKILDRFLFVDDINSNSVIRNQIADQVQTINHLLARSPYITVYNKDPSVKQRSKIGYSVQAFDSVYSRIRITGDGNCLYNSLSLIKIGSERLTLSMRLLAINAMINNSDHFRTLGRVLNSSFEEQISKTTTNQQWGEEVQIHALSIALCQPIYSYVKFLDDPERVHYIPSDISTQNLIDRFDIGTAGVHLKYIGYKSDRSKLSLCVRFTGNHYDALLPFTDNPQQFI
jgi:hypothetical protein